jgi:hypothetical protein
MNGNELATRFSGSRVDGRRIANKSSLAARKKLAPGE